VEESPLNVKPCGYSDDRLTIIPVKLFLAVEGLAATSSSSEGVGPDPLSLYYPYLILNFNTRGLLEA